MSKVRAFIRREDGAAAAEFTLVLPLLLLLLFGTIDVGRYTWGLGMAEKATQMGARWAVATNLIAPEIGTYSYAVNGGMAQGSVVPAASFPGVRCQSNGTTASCAWIGGTGPFAVTASNADFNRLVARMRSVYPSISAQNVVVTYTHSGLGFAGDPNGPDVAPLTTVSLRNMTFAPFTAFIFNGTVGMPNLAYTLSMEDGSGTVSN